MCLGDVPEVGRGRGARNAEVSGMNAPEHNTTEHVGMGVPCCLELVECANCDVLDMRRRLVFPTGRRGPNEQPISVEVTVHTRFTRCSGPLTLGPPIYTTTLLPGEKVRLATTDRRSRFSF